MQPQSRLDALEWLQRAERDLLMAQRALDPPPLLEATAYHAQQAVEKALKAFLALHGRPFARTHDLVVLLAACRTLDPTFAAYLGVAQTLTPYAVRFRYPGGPLEPSEAEAKGALADARAIVAFIRPRI